MNISFTGGKTDPLDSVLFTRELRERMPHASDFAVENQALLSLAQHLADSPSTILSKLADTIIVLLRSGSAGISLLSEATGDFYWPAISGEWRPYTGGGTPRRFGPCGVVLDRSAVQLFRHPERYYPYLTAAEPTIEEALLAPFYVDGVAVGTVWAIAHDPNRRFDLEDQRVLTSLSIFAAAAYKVLEGMQHLEKRTEALRRNETRLANELQERVSMLEREQRAHAEAEAASKAKDRFLAMLSHELRTPLTPVVLVMSALETDPKLPPEMREDIAMVRRNVDLETRLIDDLLDLSRVASGKFTLHRAPLRLHQVITSTLRMVTSDLEEKAIAIQIQLDGARDVVDGDATRLQQALWNLVKNAAKFTPKNGSVWVRTRNEAENIIIEIKDSGRGISKDLLAKIFEPFVQGGPEITNQFGGLGLGLAIARAVVELHGGSIRAESEGEGAGATLILNLPLAARQEISVTLLHTPSLFEAPQVRLLLIEDHADTAQSIMRLLRQKGMEVSWAKTVEEALHQADGKIFDVIVSDVGLPDGLGLDLLPELRKNGVKAPAISLSGYGTDEDVALSTAAGFAEHLTKPVNIVQLRAAIHRVTSSGVRGS